MFYHYTHLKSPTKYSWPFYFHSLNILNLWVLEVNLNSDGVIAIEPFGATCDGDNSSIYWYTISPTVFSFIKTLQPSERGELEITAVNNYYIERGACGIVRLTDTFWSDCGTPESLANTTRFFLDNPGILNPLV